MRVVKTLISKIALDPKTVHSITACKKYNITIQLARDRRKDPQVRKKAIQVLGDGNQMNLSITRNQIAGKINVGRERSVVQIWSGSTKHPMR